jgi:lipopolysaccharide assembly outer membrane protein LptD (OstA)
MTLIPKLATMNTGKIVDSLNTLTSQEGKYHTETDIIHFYGNVEAFNKNYTLNSDTLIYNTKTGRAFIVGPTTIKDSLNTLYAEEGWYETESGEAELIKNPSVYNKTQHLKANYIKYNEVDGTGKGAWKCKNGGSRKQNYCLWEYSKL